MEELQTKVGPKLISAILVLFVVLSALVIPTAAQSTDYSSAAPRGEWNPTTSTGTIILDGESYYTVFQGEEDVQEWRTTDGSRVPGLTL
ncbi:MAG: hypothetical protein SV760_00540, partial [Halobacteria archaeon]|nr:hypothetical protein [Halobacteria archaeon]